MRISAIRFGKLVSGPGFNNRKLEVEAIVDEGEDPEPVPARLEAFVDRVLGQQKEFDGLMGDLQRAREAVRSEERRYEALGADIATMRTVIQGHARLREIALREGIDIEGLNHTLPLEAIEPPPILPTRDSAPIEPPPRCEVCAKVTDYHCGREDCPHIPF